MKLWGRCSCCKCASVPVYAVETGQIIGVIWNRKGRDFRNVMRTLYFCSSACEAVMRLREQGGG